MKFFKVLIGLTLPLFGYVHGLDSKLFDLTVQAASNDLTIESGASSSMNFPRRGKQIQRPDLEEIRSNLSAVSDLDFDAGTTACLVTAHSIARIGAAAKGVVDRILVERGDRVKAGQVLVRLESSEETERFALARIRASSEAAVHAAESRYERMRAKADRLSSLVEKNVMSRADWEEAELDAMASEADLEQAKLDRKIAAQDLEAAQAAKERKIVRAPFDGVVTSRLLSPGELYNEQDPILVLARTDPLFVETFLPVAQRARIQVGSQLAIQLETGETVEGRIVLLDPVLDAATGTFGVRVELPNPDHSILAGQRCRIDFAG